jgi:hypothetical protein
MERQEGGSMADTTEVPGFLAWARRHGPYIPDEWDFSDTRKLRHVGDPGLPGDASSDEEDLWIWREGKKREDRFNFAPFFPFDNGGSSPYFRQRSQVDRFEAGQFFRYRQRFGADAGPFEPFPLPSPEDLAEQDED